MKVKDVIAALQKADPTGELECSVGNIDIHFICVELAYYDGCQQVLVRDPALSPHYNIVGARYDGREDSHKIVITTLPLEQAIFNDPELPVEFDGLGGSELQRYQEIVTQYRETAHRIKNDVACSFFIQYAVKRYSAYPISVVEDIAKKYYEENMRHDDPMPEKIMSIFGSWIERRRLQWDEEVDLRPLIEEAMYD